MSFGRKLAILLLPFVSILICAHAGTGKTRVPVAQQSRETTVEVFQVLELPLNMIDAVLLKTEKGYLFKCSLSNNAELKIIGLRYSIVAVDSMNVVHPLLSTIEGFSLKAYATKSLTFQTPIRIKIRDGSRFVVMLEQAIAPESIWEVVKAKESLEAYAKGDYAVMPRVLRVANQVDAPTPLRVRLLY